jgi:hypothetical protein
MEFWIAFTVTFIIGSIYSAGKRQAQKEQGSKPTATKAESDHQQKLKQADEELITVILPTINNDK